MASDHFLFGLLAYYLFLGAFFVLRGINTCCCLQFEFQFDFCLVFIFIVYLWLCWVFVAVRAFLSLGRAGAAL